MTDYLIIGGVTKAGTTSLFNYLADHPEICPAEFKETRFFLNKSYPLKKLKPGDYTINTYEKLYHSCHNENIRLEATPDYLFSKGTAQLIANTIGKDQVKLIFILRNPVDRFLSWYKFARQDGKIPREMTLQEYYELNVENINSSNTPQHLKALEQGFYSNYLPEYYKCFGEKNIKIVYFNDFISNPQYILEDIVTMVNIDVSFYANYNFERHNKTISYKYPKIQGKYKSIKREMRERIGSGKVKKQLRSVRKIIDKLYTMVNPEKEEENTPRLDEKSLSKIKTYYDQELKLFNQRDYEKTYS